MKRFCILVVIAIGIGFIPLAILSGSSPEPVSADIKTDAPYTWGTAKDGLRIGLAHVGLDSQSRPQFRVAIQNVGEKDLVLNLGMLLGNGKSQHTSALKLIVTYASGKSRELINEPGGGGIAGRMDPFIVPLPSGCSYVVRVDFDNYAFAPTTDSKPSILVRSETKITVIFEGKAIDDRNAAIPAMPYWTGSIQSTVTTNMAI